MCSSKFDFRLSLLPYLEMNFKNAPKLFLEGDFLRKHEKSVAFNQWEGQKGHEMVRLMTKLCETRLV